MVKTSSSQTAYAWTKSSIPATLVSVSSNDVGDQLVSATGKSFGSLFVGDNNATASSTGYTNSITWTKLTGAPTADYTQVTNTGSGQFIAACASESLGSYATNNGIFLSTDFGNTFLFKVITTDSQSWYGIAMNATSQYILTYNGNTELWLSKDFGSSFQQITSIINYEIVSVAISYIGNCMAVGINTGTIWVSQDYGSNWLQLLDLPIGVWNSISINSNGTTIVASEYYTGVYLITYDSKQRKYIIKKPSTSSPINCSSVKFIETTATIVASQANGSLYLSNNLTSSWTPLYQGYKPLNWTSITANSIGSIITAVNDSNFDGQDYYTATLTFIE